MRSLLLLPAVGALALVGCSDQADPTGEFALQTTDALALLPGDAGAVGMLHVAAARESGISPFEDGARGLGGLQGESGARFDEFVRLTGFNPETDIERVYVAAMSGTTEAQREAAPSFVVYADFDRARLEAYLDGQTADLRKTTHRGANLYLTVEEGPADHTFALAAPSDDFLVAGEESAVRAMLDRAASGSEAGSFAASTEAMALVRRAVYPDGAWFVVNDVPDGGPEVPGPAGTFAQAGALVEHVVVSADFGPDAVQFSALGLTQPGADAGDVADLARGGIAAARAGAKGDARQTAFLDGLAVREVAGGVEVRGTLPAADLAAMTE